MLLLLQLQIVLRNNDNENVRNDDNTINKHETYGNDENNKKYYY